MKQILGNPLCVRNSSVRNSSDSHEKVKLMRRFLRKPVSLINVVLENSPARGNNDWSWKML